MKHHFVLLLLFPLLFSCDDKRERTKPRMGPITSAVYASGIVKAKDQYAASSVVSGVLAKTYVVAGDTVRAGDPLFRIDDRSSTLMTRNAEVTYELARRNAEENAPVIQERVLAVQLARERMENDSLLFVRQKSLWEKQVGSKVEFEQRELAFRSSRTAYANAKAALEDTRSRTRRDVEVAKNNLLNNQAMKDDHIVRSLVDGRVYDVLLEAGELVTPQQKLAVLGRATEFEMELQVDEFDISSVAVGQLVHITMDSHRGSVFQGEVSRVDPLMDQRSRTFNVLVRFVDPPSVLYPNLTVEANIVTSHKEHAITIPAAYLVDGSYVLTGNNERIEVEVGLRNLKHVELLGGVDTSMVILKP